MFYATTSWSHVSLEHCGTGFIHSILHNIFILSSSERQHVFLALLRIAEDSPTAIDHPASD